MWGYLAHSASRRYSEEDSFDVNEVLFMSVTISLPETIEHQLEEEWDQTTLSRKALEGLVIEAYRAEKLSAGQVAEALGLSVIETEAFLKERGVELPYTLNDLEADRASLRKVLGE